MDELLAEFITETNEFLDTVDNQLVHFESDPNDSETLNNIFRLVHTIKGTCGFLGLPRLQFVAHAGETLLGKFRDGSVVANPDSVQLVLESIDRIKEIMADLEATGHEPEGDDTKLISALERAAEGKPVKDPAKDDDAKPETPAPAETKTNAPEVLVDENGNKWDKDLGRFLKPGEVSLAELEAAFMAAEVEDVPPKEPVTTLDAKEQAVLEEELKQEEMQAAQEAAAAKEAAPAPATTPAPKPAQEIAKTAPNVMANPPAAQPNHDGDAAKGSSVAAQTIRVNVDVLEDLMNMVSELVLTRNQLMQMVRNSANSEFKAPLQRLSTVTGELQDSVMKTRMQPVGSAWKKLPRIVRDAARDLGKKIDLVMEGENTELDRQVLELIKDPLTHMIRNSCDHAIEKPEERLAAGKPEHGTIRLNAYHEAGHIVIELSDDGTGLNTARIRDKAIKNGLVSEEQAWTMPDAQIHKFIFAPGFSTAQVVTSMSGRGVGMDVVRTNIKTIGGEVDLKSTEGKGTVFYIKIPLTLAIVSALVVGSSEQRFAIPQLSVVELVTAGGNSEHKVETLNNATVLRLRGRLLPLMSLSGALNINYGSPKNSEEDTQFVVVMQQGGIMFGIVVDEVYDTEEIVVKPLSAAIADVKSFSGATILGDGSVIMIIDPQAIARIVGETSPHGDDENDKNQAGQNNARKEEKESFIIFHAGSAEPKAVPLGVVTRLEELDASTFEQSNGKILVQYRGALMPIVPADDYTVIRNEGTQPILVFTHNDRMVGIAVDEIVDIVEEYLNVEMTSDKNGILGIAVIRGKATEILDVGYHLSNAVTDWDAPSPKGKKKSVILVERNSFFRNMLVPLLKAANYDVEAVDTVSAAFVCIDYHKPDIILTDIDEDKDTAMRFLSDKRLAEVPVIALSGSADAEAPEFAAVVRKSDHYGIVSTIDYATKKGVAA